MDFNEAKKSLYEHLVKQGYEERIRGIGKGWINDTSREIGFIVMVADKEIIVPERWAEWPVSVLIAGETTLL